MSGELKPCPFCGGGARVFQGWSELDNYVGCCKCGARTQWEHTEQKAVENWNRRVADER